MSSANGTVYYVGAPGEDRDHTVYRYTDQIYKVIQWYGVHVRTGPGPKDQQQHHEKKLDSSISRTKRLILEKALCNHWDWFCTFTIAEGNFDRKDLAAWHNSFAQWLRDQRKKGLNLKWVIVPERHKDGSWHAHGLFSGLDKSQMITFREMDKQGYRSANGRRLPKWLRNSNYMNWPAYQAKFGFCSFGAIKNQVAASFYITKYITKDNDRMVSDVGLHSFYASKPLAGPTKHLDFYGRDPSIDRLLVNKYDFCATGMTHIRDNADWTFCMEYANFDDMEPLSFSPAAENALSAPEMEADEYYQFEQMMLKM